MNASSRFSPAVFLLVLTVACPGRAGAQALVFPDFSSPTGLTFNSAVTGTTSDGSVAHLANNSRNDRGSVFTTGTRNVSSFSTAFQFRLSNRGGSSDGTSAGADGLVFVIQREGKTALGSNGEGLGYLGIGSSIGVEFDTFQNGGRSDPSSNHVGIDFSGSVTSAATANVATNFDDGNRWTVWIDYNGSTLEVRTSQSGERPGASLLSCSLSLSTLSSTLGGTSAYVGFTASTGGAWADHDLISWTFSDTFIAGGVTAGLTPVPEPGTYAAIAGVLALLIAALRRSSRDDEAEGERG